MANFVIGRRARRSDDADSSSDSVKASWKTSRKGQGRRISFSSKLMLGFALSSVMTVGILLIVLSIVWEGQFLKYTRSNMQSLATATAEGLSERYEEAGGWTDDVLEYASSATSTSSDAGIQVLDEDGVIIYDDTWATPIRRDDDGPEVVEDANRSDQVETSKKRVARDKVSLAPSSSDSTVSATVKDSSGKSIGTVRVWANGSDALLTKADAAFRRNSYVAIWTAAIVAILIACFMGIFVAGTIAAPIKRITSTVSQIRNGDLTARTGVDGSDELGQLGQTFDDMASNLERDLKLEHRLTSDVAHELRTPLMAMLATVEAMQDGVLPADEERLGTLGDETRRLSRLVDAMLQLSRMENGTTKFNPQRTDVVGLVRGIVVSQEQLFADRGLRLRFNSETPRGECYAEVDRDMVRQAVINFMSNALRYTPEGGWVVVNVGQDHSDVLISVSDTGIGIAKEDLARVFGRFWRSDASRERASGGLGVGLSVTKEIADRHHGFISVESELNRGTMFTLHLPLENRAEEDSSATMKH